MSHPSSYIQHRLIKRSYTGYLDTLYSTTTFAFTSLRQFQTFTTTIPPHRLQKITTLEIYTELDSSHLGHLDTGWEEIKHSQWRKSWEIIATMSKLRFLHVHIRMDDGRLVPETSYSGVHKWMEDRIFDPMRGLRGPDVFKVEVNWGKSREFVLGEDAPFLLERRLKLSA